MVELVEGGGLVDGVLDVVEEGGDDLVDNGGGVELDLLDVGEALAELDLLHGRGKAAGVVLELLAGDGVVLLVVGGGLDGAG